MKGIIFREFVTMVEQELSREHVSDLLTSAQLESNGSYTSTETYNHTELVTLALEASKRSGIPVALLIQRFGKFLLTQFSLKYPKFFTDANDAFDFLAHLESTIHLEIREIYPDAELPNFYIRKTDKNTLEMTYSSERPLEDLAHGLIEGTIEYYGEPIDIERQDNEHGASFIITKKCETPA